MAKTFKTPGDVVKTQAAAYNLSITQLAEGIKISPSAARLLINNKLRISISFAQRLSKFFGKTPKYWIDLQTAYELSILGSDKKEAAVLKTISKAEKAPVARKNAAKTTAKKAATGKVAVAKAAAGKAGTRKTTARKATARSAGAKPVAAKKATAKKAGPGRKAAAKTTAPRAKRTVRKTTAAAPKPASQDQATPSPWTFGSDN
jgi:addiction module HigA family antidote